VFLMIIINHIGVGHIAGKYKDFFENFFIKTSLPFCFS